MSSFVDINTMYTGAGSDYVQSFLPMTSTQPSLVQFQSPTVHALNTLTPSCTHWPHSSATPSTTYNSCSQLPWSIQTEFSCGTPPQSTSDIMRFSANNSTMPSSVECNMLSQSSSSSLVNHLLHGKRKAADLMSECPKPAKIFINEERIAARMNDLHLDNNNLDRHPDLEHEPWFSQQKSVTSGCMQQQHYETPVSQLPPQTTCINKSTGHIELCRELQLGLKTKQLLPQVVLDEINKFSMQVVLWQPREKVLQPKVAVDNKTQSDDDVTEHSDRMPSAVVADLCCQQSTPCNLNVNNSDTCETMDL